MPKTTMNESTAVRASRWKSCSAIAGRIVRSSPTIAPTNALITTSRENWARFSRIPSIGCSGDEAVVIPDPYDRLI